MQAAEVLGDARNHVAHLFLVGDIAQVGAGVAAGRLAGRYRFIQPLLVQVHQCQPRALARQVFAHGPAEALTAASDDDDFVLKLHAYLHVVVLLRERRPPGKPLC